MFWDPGSAGKLMRIRNTGQMYRENGFKYSRGRVSVITHVFNFLHVYLIPVLFKSCPPVFLIRMDDWMWVFTAIRIRTSTRIRPAFALIYPKSTNNNCTNLQSKLNIICPYIKYIIFNRPMMFIDKFLEEPGQNKC